MFLSNNLVLSLKHEFCRSNLNLSLKPEFVADYGTCQECFLSSSYF